MLYFWAEAGLCSERVARVARPANATIVLFLDKRGEVRVPFGEHHARVPLLARRKGLSLFPPFFRAFAILRRVPGAQAMSTSLKCKKCFYIQKPENASISHTFDARCSRITGKDL